MQLELLPLFPLQLVLLPQTNVSLHVFEERYKEMIGAAIQSKSEFGMVLAIDNGIVEIGCTAVVDRVARQYDDGRMDIVAKGRRRFAIQSLNNDKDFLRCSAEYFDDDVPEEPVDGSLRQRVIAEYKELADRDDSLLNTLSSFEMGDIVSDIEVRQRLLVCRSEAERMRMLASYLPTAARRQRETHRAQAVAVRNGHVRKSDDL